MYFLNKVNQSKNIFIYNDTILHVVFTKSALGTSVDFCVPALWICNTVVRPDSGQWRVMTQSRLTYLAIVSNPRPHQLSPFHSPLRLPFVLVLLSPIVTFLCVALSLNSSVTPSLALCFPPCVPSVYEEELPLQPLSRNKLPLWKHGITVLRLLSTLIKGGQGGSWGTTFGLLSSLQYHQRGIWQVLHSSGIVAMVLHVQSGSQQTVYSDNKSKGTWLQLSSQWSVFTSHNVVSTSVY